MIYGNRLLFHHKDIAEQTMQKTKLFKKLSKQKTKTKGESERTEVQKQTNEALLWDKNNNNKYQEPQQ